MTLTLDRQNAYRERYRARNPGWRPATEVYEATIREYLKPGMRVLDLGCGRGGVLEQLGEAVERPIGFDPDLPSLREHRMPGLPRAVALSDALPLRAGTLDMVVCSWVFEHLERPAHTFAEIRRALRPGGKVIFLTPNAKSVMVRLNRTLRPLQKILVSRLYGRAEADTFPVRYQANTQQQIAQIASQTGLHVERFALIEDPTYLAFTSLLFSVSIILSEMTPPVHILGVLAV